MNFDGPQDVRRPKQGPLEQLKSPKNDVGGTLGSFLKREAIKQEAVIKTHDTRRQVGNTFEWPFCAIGEITSWFENNGTLTETKGTVTMVGPRVAITAAHNIYSHVLGQARESVVVLGLMGMFHMARCSVLKPTIFPASYKLLPFQERLEFDYAFIVLDTDDFRDFTGFIGMKTSLDPRNQVIGIYGYPQDKYTIDFTGELNSSLWGDVGIVGILPSSQNTLIYSIPTNPGQSGAALLSMNGLNTRIVGVHTNGGKSLNLGIKLTTKMLESARKDLKSYHGLILY